MSRIWVFGLCLLLLACDEQEQDVPPLERVRDALSHGDGVAAETLLRDMLAAGSSRGELAAFMAEAELAQGNLVAARNWLTEEKLSAESRAYGFHMLGRLEMIEGNLPAAGQAFDLALQNGGESAELWTDIGRLRYKGGEQEQAVEASIRAIELDPSNAAAQRFRGQLLRDSQGLQAGIEWFEKALEDNPEHAGLLADYAATLGDYGRGKDMLNVLQKLHEVDPRNRQTTFLQAILAARAGNFDLAGLLLFRSGQLERQMPAAMLLSGILDMENGNYASAAQTLDRLASHQPDNIRARELLARTLALGGNHKELIHRFEDDARQPGASSYLQTLVGRSFEALNEREKAAYFLDAALRGNRSRVTVIENAGPDNLASTSSGASGFSARDQVRFAIAEKRHDQAINQANELVQRFRGSGDALVLSGDSYLAANRPDRALERYDRAAAIRRTWPLLRKMVAALELQRRAEDSMILQSRYFAGDPGNAQSASLLAREAFLRKDWQLAAAYGDHALANGNARDLHTLLLMSDILRYMGNNEDAVEMAEIAYGLQPLNREATLALARAYADAEGGEALVPLLQAKAQKLPQ